MRTCQLVVPLANLVSLKASVNVGFAESDCVRPDVQTFRIELLGRVRKDTTGPNRSVQVTASELSVCSNQRVVQGVRIGR